MVAGVAEPQNPLVEDGQGRSEHQADQRRPKRVVGAACHQNARGDEDTARHDETDIDPDGQALRDYAVEHSPKEIRHSVEKQSADGECLR